MIFRCNMNHLFGYFQPPELKRGLNKDWPTQPGCQYTFGPCRDRLHLMLKITDRLEEGIIMDILEWDEVIISVFLSESNLYAY